VSHSLCASGVMPSHASNACGSDARVFFRSAGTSCITPLEIFFFDIDKLSFRKLHRREDLAEQRMCVVRPWRRPDAQDNSALDSAILALVAILDLQSELLPAAVSGRAVARYFLRGRLVWCFAPIPIWPWLHLLIRRTKEFP